MNVVKLYDFWRSSSAWRVRIALHHKGIVFETVPIDLFGGEHNGSGFADVNKMQQVPVLELEYEGQLVRVTQSLAIIELLEQLYPYKRLFPADPVLRARAIQLTEIVNSGIQPLQNRSTMLHVSGLGADSHSFAKHFISRGLTALEAEAKESSGKFLIGDTVCIADLYLVPQMDNARRLDVDLDELPSLTRIDAELAELPAFRAAHPDKQPGAQRPG